MTTTDKLCAELKARREMGLNKYGVSIDDNQLTIKQWLQHAKEEAMDMALYLHKAQKQLNG